MNNGVPPKNNRLRMLSYHLKSIVPNNDAIKHNKVIKIKTGYKRINLFLRKSRILLVVLSFNAKKNPDIIKNKSTAFCPFDVIDCSFVYNPISGNKPDNLGIAKRCSNIMVMHPITLKKSMFFSFCMLNIPWLIY